MPDVIELTEEALSSQYDVDKLSPFPYDRNSLGGVHFQTREVECPQSCRGKVFLVTFSKQSLNILLQRLMSSHVIEDLKSSILDFQANEARFVLRKKHEPVDPLENPDHYELLRFIWQSSKLESSADETNSELVKWRKLGFESEDVNHEFMNVGVLGLESLVSISNPLHS